MAHGYMNRRGSFRIWRRFDLHHPEAITPSEIVTIRGNSAAMSPSPDFNRRRDGIVTRSTALNSVPRRSAVTNRGNSGSDDFMALAASSITADQRPGHGPVQQRTAHHYHDGNSGKSVVPQSEFSGRSLIDCAPKQQT
jgi:hypothetical protein